MVDDHQEYFCHTNVILNGSQNIHSICHIQFVHTVRDTGVRDFELTQKCRQRSETKAKWWGWLGCLAGVVSSPPMRKMFA